MALSYITVKGTFLGADGLPEVGYVEFRPNVPLTLAAGGVVIPEPVRADLNSSGAFSALLLATDNVDVFPYGWYWVVDEKVEHGNLWYLMTNTVAGGGRNPLDISNAYRPIGDSDQVPVVVQPGPAGVKGDQGTVSVDSTLTGEPGTEAIVIDLDPLSTNAKLQFVIPRGEKGAKGDTGAVTGVGIPEIYAQPNEPAALAANVLWVDIDDVAGTGGAGGSIAEIYLQPGAPAPTGNNILWVDTDDTTTEVPSDHLTQTEADARYFELATDNVATGKQTVVNKAIRVVMAGTTGVGSQMFVWADGLMLQSVNDPLSKVYTVLRHYPDGNIIILGDDLVGRIPQHIKLQGLSHSAVNDDGTAFVATADTHIATKKYADTKWTMWTGTQAAYDAIGTKDANTLYVVI